MFVSVEVDQAVEIFTTKFNQILDNHAPWTIFQERKYFSPWITEDTLRLIKSRNNLKLEAVNLIKQGLDATEAWDCYRRLRNQVNNRLKFDI